MKILKSDEFKCSLMVYSYLNMSRIWPFLLNNFKWQHTDNFFFFVQVNKHFITFHRNVMNGSKYSEVCKFDLSSFRILYVYRNTKRNWSTKPMLPWTGHLIFGTVICSTGFPSAESMDWGGGGWILTIRTSLGLTYQKSTYSFIFHPI